MGQAASAGRSYKAAEAVAKATGEVASQFKQAGGAVAVDAERAAMHARRAALTLEEEEQMESKDQALGTLLDKLGGSIHGKAVNIMPTEPVASVLPSSTGRLPPPALQELLELQRQAAGGPVDATHLVHKFKADPQLMQHVLSTVCLPELVQAEGSAGVEAFAEYPAWFQRRQNASSS